MSGRSAQGEWLRGRLRLGSGSFALPWWRASRWSQPGSAHTSSRRLGLGDRGLEDVEGLSDMARGVGLRRLWGRPPRRQWVTQRPVGSCRRKHRRSRLSSAGPVVFQREQCAVSASATYTLYILARGARAKVVGFRTRHLTPRVRAGSSGTSVLSTSRCGTPDLPGRFVLNIARINQALSNMQYAAFTVADQAMVLIYRR